MQAFDSTLTKYRDNSLHAEKTAIATPKKDKTVAIDYLFIFDSFVEYKASNGSKTNTLRLYEVYRKLLATLSDFSPLQVKAQLLKVTTEQQTKKVLQYLSAACDFGIRFNLCPANPYKGMSDEMVKPKWQTEPTPCAFSASELQEVFEGFANHDHHCYYLPFVRFLAATGCRPSEAVGLQWENISDDCKAITFNGSLQYIAGVWVTEVGSKANRKRVFPCNEALQALLKSMKRDTDKPTDLVFKSPRAGAINYNNFGKRIWHSIADTIKVSTPYSLRDTFISQQIAKGVPIAIIAKWCDNSVVMIEKYYCDASSFKEVLPK